MPIEEKDSTGKTELARSIRRIIYVLTGTALLFAGFMMGRAFNNAAHGYHYRVLETKEYASDLGPIEWTHFFESEGTPFMDLDKTMLTMGNRTIYKAQRDFQEDAPYARNIKTSGNSITWDDGDYAYHLTVGEIKDGKSSGETNALAPLAAPLSP